MYDRIFWKLFEKMGTSNIMIYIAMIWTIKWSLTYTGFYEFYYIFGFPLLKILFQLFCFLAYWDSNIIFNQPQSTWTVFAPKFKITIIRRFSCGLYSKHSSGCLKISNCKFASKFLLHNYVSLLVLVVLVGHVLLYAAPQPGLELAHSTCVLLR